MNTSSESDITQHKILEAIANNATRSEKISWERKMDNLVKLLAKLHPIEDEILSLMASKLPLVDEVQKLRAEMVNECVHPYTNLVYDQSNDVVLCKFCNRKLSVPNQ